MPATEKKNIHLTTAMNKYLDGTCSKEEARKVVDFLENHSNDQEIKKLFGSHWDFQDSATSEIELSGEERLVIDRILDRLHHRIRLAEEAPVNKQTTYKKIITLFSKVAAVLILPLLLYSIYATEKIASTQFAASTRQTVWQTIKTQAGMQTDFELPDGSHIWLNSGSVFKYPLTFDSKYRQVELLGEAYFDIKKVPDHPFLVQTGKMNVEVKGTRFDVINYSNENSTELILESGCVRLFTDNYSANKTIASIKPGESALYDNLNNKLTIRKVDVDKYTAWKEGKLIFRDDRMDEVVKKLNRWFNVDIVLRSAELNEYVYTATYKNETLNQILELLAISAPIQYSISDRERQGDNSYSKRKIVLTKRKI
jgi:transmembrane sensor